MSIPYDLYESQHEIVVVLPLGGVKKDSITLKLKDHNLCILWERNSPIVREDCVSVIQECFWGDIECIIQLPPTITYNTIHSSLSKENILTIIIPKNFIPDAIPVTIED